MGILIHDVRHGVRSLLKTPGLTAAAILSLALGIGANTTIFTWVKAVLLRPVPGASDPASSVRRGGHESRRDSGRLVLS